MIDKLLEKLKGLNDNIYIQTHNFPDPDAVASAYGLQQLLRLKGIETRLIYDGMIQRAALINMINEMSIDIRKCSDYDLKPEDKIIIVDGCKWNTNVTDLTGEEIAVIDHHPVREPEGVGLVDIRPEVGACASIITSYYMKLEIPVPETAATVLLTGLFRDTDSLTRGVSHLDAAAYGELYKTADYDWMSTMVLNNITLEDLRFFNYVINNMTMKGRLAFCKLKDPCNQNLLGILGDFLLSIDEVRFTALFAENGDSINISFRNGTSDINAADLMKKTVRKIGTGGGHRQMAGGVIFRKEDFDEDKLFRKIASFVN
ncbi:DHH family phosphoesterase [Spirochaeta isovalerica]|uniref:NanoRNase/pAp phosphatase (C-di-AMP/oligoRNAs hydrolase) n=1 Tax=Spirochaeta isovalerica TaxID=150 RepID=A0A841RG08_9SPIO|nr:DHHA1 domain-containing protein [Spirochaeta isovalerica]MBB6481282.1 nanoRNase/pAp phosphatase (c-di-AMP/oligoRNAs hydrolase) [Spirochaeta isovalerica]